MPRWTVVAAAAMFWATVASGDAQPAGRFSISGSGVVVDQASGLMWAQDVNLPGFTGKWDGFTWQEAVRFIDEMNARKRPNFSYSDWRLPRASELVAVTRATWRLPTTAEDLTRSFVFATGMADLYAPDAHGFRKRVETPFAHLDPTAFWSGTLASADGQPFREAGYVGNGGTSAAIVDPARRIWAVDTTGIAFVLDQSAAKRVWPVRGGMP